MIINHNDIIEIGPSGYAILFESGKGYKSLWLDEYGLTTTDEWFQDIGLCRLDAKSRAIAYKNGYWWSIRGIINFLWTLKTENSRKRKLSK